MAKAATQVLKKVRKVGTQKVRNKRRMEQTKEERKKQRRYQRKKKKKEGRKEGLKERTKEGRERKGGGGGQSKANIKGRWDIGRKRGKHHLYGAATKDRQEAAHPIRHCQVEKISI